MVSYHVVWLSLYCVFGLFFFQAEDGIRDLVRSRGLGDVYKRQDRSVCGAGAVPVLSAGSVPLQHCVCAQPLEVSKGLGPMLACLLYTSDAADERSSVDLGGRRIIKKKKTEEIAWQVRLHPWMPECVDRDVIMICDAQTTTNEQMNVTE